MVGRHGQHEVLHEELHAFESIVVHRQREQPDIEPAVAQLFVHDSALLLDQEQLDLGEPFVQRRHDMREQVGRERGEQPDPEASCLRIGRSPGHVTDGVGLAQHHPGPLHHGFADGGQHDVARVALDQLDTELTLELLDLRRQGRLTDEAGLSCTAEVAVIRDCDQVAKVLEVHRSAGAQTSAGS